MAPEDLEHAGRNETRDLFAAHRDDDDWWLGALSGVGRGLRARPSTTLFFAFGAVTSADRSAPFSLQLPKRIGRFRPGLLTRM
jgi:hypothetical protein